MQHKAAAAGAVSVHGGEQSKRRSRDENIKAGSLINSFLPKRVGENL